MTIKRTIIRTGYPCLCECPYYARYYQLPGHDPDATCSMGCWEEPACITSHEPHA